MPSILDRKKRGRGRPSTGLGKPVGLRLYVELEQKVDAWASRQTDKPGRPEAIRRLVEMGLANSPDDRPTNKWKALKAAEMAGRAIQGMGDKSMPVEEHARRKRALIKGP
jgi:hypothetical protein